MRSLCEIEADLEGFLLGLEVGTYSTADAAVAMKTAARIENRAGIAKAFFAARATVSSGWRDSGARSEAEWYAHQTGTSIGDAKRSLGAAKQAARSDAFNKAARSGNGLPR